MKKIKILTVFGTRPEIIKLAPFIQAVESDEECVSVVCATTQQRELQNEALAFFNIKVNHDLMVMREAQDLFHITDSVMNKIKSVLDFEKPDYMIVQGDTTTAFVSALSAFYHKIPVVHVEAGLRTHNIFNPYPEEANRSLISRIASLHMAPTHQASTNLAQEGITQNVFTVGNTIIDAVQGILQHSFNQNAFINEMIQSTSKKILITVHRRENFDNALKEICSAILNLSKKYPDFLFIWPIHPNPNIKKYVQETMSGIDNIKLIDPVSYVDLICLLNACTLILSDSGGIQEEACILGKNIIILRNETERPEVIQSGFGLLAGSDQSKIVSYFDKFVDSADEKNAQQDLYGKPGVSRRILETIKAHHQRKFNHSKTQSTSIEDAVT